MATITLNTSFNRFNGDRSLAVKPNSTSREREAVVNVAFGASEDYATNGITLDFSKIGGRFTQVYSCEVVHKDLGLNMSYVPATGNAAATGKLKIWGTDGNELSNGNTGTRNKNLVCIIRGI